MKRNSMKFDIKNKKALILSLGVTLVLTALLSVLFFSLGNTTAPPAVSAEDTNPVKNSLPEVNEQKRVVDYTEVSDMEMRGMWIASTINIDYPSKQGLTTGELKKELDSIIEKAYELGINSIFFQVRPASDALYKSYIFPSSRYLSGIQGVNADGFDSLEYILLNVKKYNIDVHAWINPYRVSMNEEEMQSLADTNPAKMHPEYTVKYADGKTYYNPALPEVRKLVVDGVKEIVHAYPDLAGIHFDDYFYPYPVAGGVFDDAAQYASMSNGLTLDNWRRNNVNTLIKETYDAIKAINPECAFGVSVFGIWANKGSDTPVEGSNTNGLEAYSSLYCDALSWAKGGYVDYLAPQDYWSFSTSEAPFDEVARWWNANLDGTGVDLYIGHAAYKSGDYSKNEIYKQVEFARSLATYKGSIFYGYENICGNVGGVADDIKKACNKKIMRSEPVSNGKGIKINYPSNNEKLNISNSYMIGSCDPAYPLYVNGTPVSKTTGGYFGLYLPLTGGKNVFTFTQNGTTLTHVINSTKNNYNSVKKLDGMEITSPFPSETTWLKEGERLYVSCVAPAGSKVTAKLGENEILLEPTINPEGEGKYLYEYYEGEFEPMSLVEETEIKLLGNVEFSAVYANQTATATGGEISRKGTDAFVYAQVKEDYTHTKVGTSSSFYDDFLPSSKGMRDYVTSASDGYYKMRFGGYIKQDDVVLTYDKPLMLNTILTTAIEVNVLDSTNNKANSTDIRFGVTENIPVDVDFNGDNGEMRIIIYNTDTSIIPQFEVPENPLIASIVGKVGTKENMLMYHVTLKEKSNFYGFKIAYEDGCMILRLNNPQTTVGGDKPLTGKRILVDAGHGGSDIGAPGPGDIPEKALNGSIASLVAKKLRDLGAEVVETRPNDELVDLYSRIDTLIAECPDIAVSIHHNSIAASSNALKTRGFMALYSNNSGVSLASTVAEVVCEELGRNLRSTAYQQLAVCRNHMFPSALYEMSFISNVEEFQWTINDGNIERSADAIVKGIMQYYKNQEKYLDY